MKEYIALANSRPGLNAKGEPDNFLVLVEEMDGACQLWNDDRSIMFRCIDLPLSELYLLSKKYDRGYVWGKNRALADSLALYLNFGSYVDPDGVGFYERVNQKQLPKILAAFFPILGETDSIYDEIDIWLNL